MSLGCAEMGAVNRNPEARGALTDLAQNRTCSYLVDIQLNLKA